LRVGTIFKDGVRTSQGTQILYYRDHGLMIYTKTLFNLRTHETGSYCVWAQYLRKQFVPDREHRVSIAETKD
jgi:hypothetical protein